VGILQSINYAVTGHTAGLGQALYQKFTPNCAGFSKSNGFDITSKDSRQSIITACAHADIFINNAYDNNGQVLMLYDLFETWKNQDKLIVNIGSNSSCGIKSYPHIYAVNKYALDKASEQLSNLNAPCKVVNIRFGWIGTTRVLIDHKPAEYISIDDAVTYISEQVRWAKKYRVTECIIRP
jgi:NAD(P)-dependent dehydrogenase (short-subunit alcohol dehydrogenase family)